MNPSPLVAASGVGGMFAICVFLVVWIFRVSNGQQRTLVDQQHELLRQNRVVQRREQWCTRRLNIVIVELDRNGIKVPDEVWLEPPDEEPSNA